MSGRLATPFFSLSKIARTTINRNIVQHSKKPNHTPLFQIRSYIRPYYNNEPSLSKALKEQRNPFHRIGHAINSIDPNKVLWSVIGVNAGVYCLWQYAINSYKHYGDPTWLARMINNFIVSPEAIKDGRIHTLLTSAFSHKSLNHIGVNMFVLYSMGQGVIEAIGASRFLLLYAGAGITASAAAVIYKAFIRPHLEQRKYGRSDLNMGGSLGASGSVMGITTFFACAFPRATFLVFFVVPMPAIAFVGLFAAYDIYQASTLNSGIVDSAAHVGGVAYGAAYWFLRVKPLLRAGRWKF